MIHGSVLATLTEEEQVLLNAIVHDQFGRIGIAGRYEWVKMFKVDALRHILSNINNLTDAGTGIRDTLVSKLSSDGF
jgi:hypothetical protein